LNRQPISGAIYNTYSYVSQTTAATATTGGTGGVPGITTTQDTVGTVISVLPTVFDDNTMAISLSLDDSNKNQPKSFSSGGQTVQLRDVTGTSRVIRTTMRNGSTLIIAASERAADTNSRSSLTENSPTIFGKSSTSERTREGLYWIVTAVADES
jgi:hypothetical protein